jgi:hypothetical protein
MFHGCQPPLCEILFRISFVLKEKLGVYFQLSLPFKTNMEEMCTVHEHRNKEVGDSWHCGGVDNFLFPLPVAYYAGLLLALILSIIVH